MPKSPGAIFLFRVRAVIMRYVESGTESTYTTDGLVPPRRGHPPLPFGTLQHVLRCLSGGVYGRYRASLGGLSARYARFSVSGTSCVGFSVLIFPDDIFDRVCFLCCFLGRVLTTTNNLLPFIPSLSLCGVRVIFLLSCRCRRVVAIVL